MSTESFDPFSLIEKNPSDFRVEFDYLGVHHHRFVRSMARSDAIRIVMLSCGICPTKRRDLVRVTIKTRKEIAQWKPTNQKPAW